MGRDVAIGWWLWGRLWGWGMQIWPCSRSGHVRRATWGYVSTPKIRAPTPSGGLRSSTGVRSEIWGLWGVFGHLRMSMGVL